MRTLPLFLTLFLSFCFGCKKPTSTWERIPLSGEVTVNQQPFAGGISFKPAGGVSGPSAGTDGIAGRYCFSAADGPVAGLHTVELMPASSSPLENEVIELSVEVPDAPPFELDLAFEIDSEVNSSSFAAKSDASISPVAPTTDIPFSNSGTTPSTGLPTSPSAKPAEEQGPTDDETENGKVKGGKVPERGPNGKGV